MTHLKEKISRIFDELIKKDKIIRIIVIIGLAGILLIALSSEKIYKSKDEKQSERIQEQNQNCDPDVYKEQIKTELEQVLSCISGVGECKVMVTVEGTAEFIYAQNTDKATDHNSQDSNENIKSEIVVIDESGNDKALIKKVIKPKISGVVVVCRGGENETTRERVIKAVSAALDLSYNKICVEAKK